MSKKLTDLLKKLRKSKGLTQQDLATLSGISRSYYNEIESGSKEPAYATMLTIAKSLNVDIDVLMNIDDIQSEELIDMTVKPDSDIVLIPLVGEIRAGIAMYANENIETYLKVDATNISQGKTYFYLKVVGDSMDRTIMEGDLVLVEHTSDVKTGDIVIALTKDDEATIKRIRLNSDEIVLLPNSYNIEYTPTRHKPEDLTIIGKVVKAERYF